MAKSKNYLNKKDLLEEIYKSREQDELTSRCTKMLMLLAQKTIRKLYYKCEDDRQHALSEAYFDLAKNWRKFDPDFARFHGYADLKPGDKIRVHPEKGSDRTAAAIVLENYPIEKLIEEKEEEIKNIGAVMTTFGFSYDEKSKELSISYCLPENYNRKTGEGKREREVYDASDYNRIKLEYIVKKNQRDIAIFDKEQIIIKDPNPFSFFTSSCINGYAKGWKRLYPKKSKGLLLSIDSGYNTDGDGMHSL
tara:strand:+ start:823 stop:1572 length:750 start_codon:yes stop_codon:yes gene_type:complete